MLRRLLARLARLWAPGWAFALLACSAAQHNPECDGIGRHELTAQLAAEVAVCPDEPCIDEAVQRHHARREKWVSCGRP
jgi:hypothetical protein